MSLWNVTVEVAGEEPGPAPEVFEELLDVLLDLLAPFDAVLLGPAEEPADGRVRYGADLTIDAYDAGEAVTRAVNVLEEYATKAGLPIWPVVRVEAKSEAELDAELSRPTPALVGVTELAAMVGVSRQRASALARQVSFPQPVAELATGPVWLEPDVRRFVAEWPRRPGRPKNTG